MRSYSIGVLLNIADLLPNEPGTGRMRSRLSSEDERNIVIVLQKNNMLVSRSLSRADTLGIKFYVGLLLSEYIWFWRGTEEGRSMHKAFAKGGGNQSREHVLLDSTIRCVCRESPVVAD